MELEKNADVKSRMRCSVQASHLCSCSEKAQRHPGGDPAVGDASELSEESLPYLSTSLDADIEMYKRGRSCNMEVCGSQEEADGWRRTCEDTRSHCRGCDVCRQIHSGEDSQLEYISANEQDSDEGNSSSELSEQRETIGIEALKPADPVRGVPGGGAAEEQNLVSGSCVGDQICTGAAVAELPLLLQDSLTLPVSSGTACDRKAEQAACHGVLYGNVLESCVCRSKERVQPNLLVCGNLESAEVEGALLCGGTWSAQVAASQVAEQNDRHVHSKLVEQESPLLSPRGMATQFCQHAGDSHFHSCEEPLLCTCGTSCAAKGIEKHCPVSAVLTSEDPFFGEAAAEKSCSGNSTSLSSEMECCESSVKVTSSSKVNQAVDASSDFRACFTTSRSTSAWVHLVSRAINTEITMMNKSRPVGWHQEMCADAACNTEWPPGTGQTEEISSQLVGMLEKHSGGSAAAAERSSPIKEQWESKTKLCSSDLKVNTDRPVLLDKETVKNSVSSCCQNLLQRAIEAELQVLNAHYQMCYRHCSKIYKLALEENMCFSRSHGTSFPKTELGSSHSLALEELKKNYSTMKAKIKMGIPLKALPPLSVEMNLTPMASYVPCKVFREDLCCDSVSDMRKADVEAPKVQEIQTAVNMGNPPTTCLTEGRQPGDSASSKMCQEQPKGQSMQHGYVKNEEGNEHWFDAKEDFIVTDFSVISEEMEKQQEKHDTVYLREAKITESANECLFVCVGGLSSSVSEGDLRSHFQKYQISRVLLCVDSGKHRFAFLGFKDTNEAKLAVEEMNKIKIKGKTVSVELVNSSSESRSSVSQILKKKFWRGIHSVDSSQRNDQDKTLTSASSSVEAADTTSAPEKVPLLPTTSLKVPRSAQVPSETKCPGPKSSAEDSVHFLVAVNQKDTGEDSLPKTSAPFSTNSLETFVTPNSLNLSSFTKLMKKLQEIHPEASRDKIVDALLEVRKHNNGILSGLSINSIMERASLILRKPTPACMEEKQSQ